MIYVISPSGEVLRTIGAPVEEAEANLRPGETWVVASNEYATGEWYYSGAGFVKIPDPPSAFHRWSQDRLEWTLDEEKAWASVRSSRDARLRTCDWTQLSDIPEQTRVAWIQYRQLLRDITSQPDPLSIQWPNPPA